MNFLKYIVLFLKKKIIHKTGIYSCFQGIIGGKILYFLREVDEKYNLASRRRLAVDHNLVAALPQSRHNLAESWEAVCHLSE